MREFRPFKTEAFSMLAENASKELLENLDFKFKTVSKYRTAWRGIERFMIENDIRTYSADVETKFFEQKFNGRKYYALTQKEKGYTGRIKALTTYHRTGKIEPVVVQVRFEGALGNAFRGFLLEKERQRVHPSHLRVMEIHTYKFYEFLQQNSVSTVDEINQDHIIRFLLGLDPKLTSLPRTVIDILRPLFRYLFANDLTRYNLSRLIPKHNYKTQSVLPSLYTKEEVEAVIQSIDTDNLVGKRDYAIVLLAARLGIRASDICNLKFENIDWDKCTVSFCQLKTGKENILPLSEEVGMAIINYIRYGRPQVENTPFIFLKASMPYNPVLISTIYNIVDDAFRRAGVDTHNRHHGPHSLRHSLAGRLLKEHTSFPVISEILGHQRTETTMYYVRVDLTSMRQFALEVPPVEKSFYTQKGGFFYE